MLQPAMHDPSPSLSVRVDPSAGTNLQLSNPFQNTYILWLPEPISQLTATDASETAGEKTVINVASLRHRRRIWPVMEP